MEAIALGVICIVGWFVFELAFISFSNRGFVFWAVMALLVTVAIAAALTARQFGSDTASLIAFAAAGLAGVAWGSTEG
jgi:hypothetical protein